MGGLWPLEESRYMEMIEDTLISYLNDNNIHSYSEEQEELESEYVIVVKQDNYPVNFLNYASMRFEVYSDSLYNSASLTEKVKALILDLLSRNDFTSVTIENSYPEINEQTKQYRHIIESNMYFY